MMTDRGEWKKTCCADPKTIGATVRRRGTHILLGVSNTVKG
jgi:hypothetical protein